MEEEKLINKYKELIERSFNNAENYKSKINQDILDMDGMSGKKTRHFYNNLLEVDDARYLEIGTWKGSSVCSAMFGNKAKVVCIDNWSEFDGPKDDFLVNLSKFKGDNEVKFIEKDSFKVDLKEIGKINIYMYDGNHRYMSQYKALEYYYDILDDISIYIVDDWNNEEIRSGTIDAINDLKFQKLYEKEVRLTWDDSHTPQPLARDTWWNGMYVVILKKTK